MRFDVVTLFPEFFRSPLETGLVGKAIESGRVEVAFIDPRQFTEDRHRTVDDAPYGGGAGMVMKPEPIARAIAEGRAMGPGPVVLLSPQGRRLEHAALEGFARHAHLVLVAGRYEGFDERIRALADEEVSIGDYVLTGGEHAALVLLDGVVRLLPGTLGNEASTVDDSFSRGLLEHPHYTRPPLFGGMAVPEVLLSGHHGEIAKWRRARALERTRERRPDLLAELGFSRAERTILRSAPSRSPVVEIVLVLPREDEGKAAMRLRGLHRIAGAYGAKVAGLVPGAPEDADRLRRIEGAADGQGAEVLRDLAALGEWISKRPRPVVSATAVPAPPEEVPRIARAHLSLRGLAEKARAEGAVVLLVLGDLDWSAPFSPEIDVLLPAVRASSPDNDLPAFAALAVLLDRLVGEG